MGKNNDDIDLMAMEAEMQAPAPAASSLPDSPTTIISIDVEDGRKKRWVGSFTYQVPNYSDQIKIARLKAQLLPQGAVADPNGALITEMMAYLQVTLKEKPSWWKPEHFYDNTVIGAVYLEARRYEARFLGRDEELGTSSRSFGDESGSYDSDHVE